VNFYRLLICGLNQIIIIIIIIIIIVIIVIIVIIIIIIYFLHSLLENCFELKFKVFNLPHNLIFVLYN